MSAALFWSSILSGLIATAIMIGFLYLPKVWGGAFYDSLGAAGSLVTRRVDARSRALGTGFLFIGGVTFAFFYGWFILMFMNGTFETPNYLVLADTAAELNLFYPLFGLVMGLGQGVFISMITTFIVTDFHPLPSYRDAYTLILSYVMGHMVYGVVVMVVQATLLRLWL